MMTKKKLLFAAATVATVFLVIGYLSIKSLQLTKYKEVDLSKNIIMQFSGTNGEGRAKVQSNNLDLDMNDENNRKFVETLVYKIDPPQELWNGTEIKVTVSYSTSLSEMAHLKPIEPESYFRVKGLKAPVFTENEIPESMKEKEQDRELYQKYIEELPMEDDQADLGSIWIAGEYPDAETKQSKEFLFEDYSAYKNDAFDQAKEYGRTSSQEYRVAPVMEGEIQKGWKTVFKNDEPQSFSTD